MALVKLRARLASGTSLAMTDADRRTNEQAIAVARDQAMLPQFIAAGSKRWQAIRSAYGQIAAALDATGAAEDQALAIDVRGFLDKHQGVNATPEVFAALHRRNLEVERKSSAPDLERSR